MLFVRNYSEVLWCMTCHTALTRADPSDGHTISEYLRSSRARPATRCSSTPFRPHRAAQRTTRGPDRAAGHTCHQPYWKDPAELAERLQYQQTVEPLLSVSATLEVVTTVPVAHVADIVLDHVL